MSFFVFQDPIQVTILHRLLLAAPVSQNFFVFDNIDSWENKGQVFCRVSQLGFVWYFPHD